MTERAEYTDEEWATVLAAPVAVISAIIGSSLGGPVGIMKEVAAAVKSFEQAAETKRDNPLIVAVLLSLKERFEAFGGGLDDPALQQMNILELGQDVDRAVEACRVARELLEQKAPADMSAELRAWLLEIGVNVAHAAVEGGFFGIGGERVNQAERDMLARLAEALDVPSPL